MKARRPRGRRSSRLGRVAIDDAGERMTLQDAAKNLRTRRADGNEKAELPGDDCREDAHGPEPFDHPLGEACELDLDLSTILK